MSDYTKYTKQEMQAYAIAKNIKENQIVIVGTGLPLIGASLAKRAVCPSCHPIVESGLMDCDPVEVPRSVGDNRFMAHCAVQWPNIRFVGFEANEWLHDEDRQGGDDLPRDGPCDGRGTQGDDDPRHVERKRIPLQQAADDGDTGDHEEGDVLFDATQLQ